MNRPPKRARDGAFRKTDDRLADRLGRPDADCTVHARRGTTPRPTWSPPESPTRNYRYSTARNFTQTGRKISTRWSVGVKRPLFGSMRKTTTECESWFAASR